MIRKRPGSSASVSKLVGRGTQDETRPEGGNVEATVLIQAERSANRPGIAGARALQKPERQVRTTSPGMLNEGPKGG